MKTTSATYQVKLQHFEGPLSLLLELIRKKKLDITRISLAEVADDFLQYLEKNKVDLVNLSEFLVVASQLILIKSKALLPLFEFTEEEEEEVEELTKRLAEYRRFKEKSAEINCFWQKNKISWSGEPRSASTISAVWPDIIVRDLQATAQNIISEQEEEREELKTSTVLETINLEDKISEIKNRLQRSWRVNFQEIIAKSKNKLEIVVSFLALLEMLKRRFIVVQQNKEFGEIIIEKTTERRQATGRIKTKTT